MLELAFADKELRSACEDAACAYDEFGSTVAQALLGRLADLRAASHPLELPFATSRPAGDGKGENIVIAVAEGRSLVLGANHRKIPRTANGAVAWEQVSRLLILRLE